MIPVHWPPSFGARSKIVGSNPCERSQRAATSPPGPAPITATVGVTGELSHGWDPGAISLVELTPFVADQGTGLGKTWQFSFSSTSAVLARLKSA